MLKGMSVFFIQKVLYSFLLMETMATYMGISLVAGIVWRRANRWGAASSVIVALLETYQGVSGTVRVPEALRPYMHGQEQIAG